jgi:hypothetical protein
MLESITRSGEIYFIRERDYLTGEVSRYVKIGLTRDDRKSAARQDDHQTGNPRGLFLHHAEKVDMVSTVEKVLHWQFAAKRVTGEWFLLDDDLLARAVARCGELGVEFASHVDAIRTAEYFGGIASEGEPVAASKDALQWWAEHQIADRIVSLCDKAVGKYKSVLKTEIQEGKDIAKAGKASTHAKTKFHEDEFRQRYPHLWAAHLAPPTVGGRFVVTKMIDDELLTQPEVAAEILVVAAFEESIGEYVKNQLSLDQLSNGYIQFLSRTEYYRTRELLAKHYLMSICGDAPEIIGVCKWNRTEKTGKLDRESLRAAAPSEFAEFVSVTEIEVINLKRKAGSAAADEG